MFLSLEGAIQEWFYIAITRCEFSGLKQNTLNRLARNVLRHKGGVTFFLARHSLCCVRGYIIELSIQGGVSYNLTNLFLDTPG